MWEGWPLIPIVGGSAVFLALLILPTRVKPPSIPLPAVDRVRERDQAAHFSELAARVAQAPLPYDVRAVGEAIRQYGTAEARGDSEAPQILAEARVSAARALRSHGPSPLLGLLAYQANAFQLAVQGWEAARSEQAPKLPADLEELGGAFMARADANGWLNSNGALLATKNELAVLFRARWLSLTELSDVPELRFSLNDWRLYFGFLLRHPPRKDGPPEIQQLSFVAALERKDPEYPAQLARGILQLQLGNAEAATPAFRAHLSAHPDGEWHLLARNLLLTSLPQAVP